MGRLSRRTFVYLGLSASAQLMRAGDPGIAQGAGNHPVETNSADVQQRLLELAARQESARRATFAAVNSQAGLAELQRSLRTKFLGLIGGLPESTSAPPVKITGQIEAEDYVIEKLVFESFPGYFVSALLYKPMRVSGPWPGQLMLASRLAISRAIHIMIFFKNLRRAL